MKLRKESANDMLERTIDYYQLAADESYKKSHFYNDYSEIASKTQDRTSFLLEICKNKSVLHFGFVDAPYTKEKAELNQLLHQQMQGVTNFLYGLDIDSGSITLYRSITGDTNNSVYDLLDKDAKMPNLRKKFDYIILGEILEHVANPGTAVENLSKLSRSLHAKVVITVPNAFFVGSFAMALEGYEGVHPDHYFYFTPATLEKLLYDNGFSNVNLSFYSGVEVNGKGERLVHPGLTKNGIIAVCS